MKIEAKVIAYSKHADYNTELCTVLATFPRFILAELNTHRMLSKNSASSRAIPFPKMLKAVKETPFIPLAWQKDHRGMQGTEYLEPRKVDYAVSAWLVARNKAVEQAIYLSEKEITKQLANRLLEPFMYHTVLISGTEWENFFALRCPRYFFNEECKDKRSRKEVLEYCSTYLDAEAYKELEAEGDLFWLGINKGQAEIHMMALAEAIYDAIRESNPKVLQAGDWHIPYEEEVEALLPKTLPIPEGYSMFQYVNELKTKLSTVMCARTSYTIVGEDQKPLTYQRMVEIYTDMEQADPKHMSPFEHCSQAMYDQDFHANVNGVRDYNQIENEWEFPLKALGWCGNFRGFIQLRKTIPNENVTV